MVMLDCSKASRHSLVPRSYEICISEAEEFFVFRGVFGAIRALFGFFKWMAFGAIEKGVGSGVGTFFLFSF